MQYTNPAAHIYFPVDGRQPTTEEAVVWSCANVDNREHFPITEWYMKVFGVIPIDGGDANNNDNYIKAGWTGSQNPEAVRIISFDFENSANTSSVAEVSLYCQGESSSSRSSISKLEKCFLDTFRKIASTSVGRVLLYRLLIEIRRYQEDMNGTRKGAWGMDLPSEERLDDIIEKRNIYRSIKIESGDLSFSINCPSISIEDARLKLSILGKLEEKYSNIVLGETPLDVCIFHEMIHWYHWLRNAVRFNKESDNIYGIRLDCALLSKHYWGKVVDKNDNNMEIRMLISEKNWKNTFDLVDFEEIRAILGAPAAIQGFLNGDELSENLYRAHIGQPLRFGHGSRGFYEDNKVTDEVLNTVTLYSCMLGEKFNKNNLRCEGDEVGFQHNEGRVGLGECRVWNI